MEPPVGLYRLIPVCKTGVVPTWGTAAKVSILYDQKVPYIVRANLTFRGVRRALVLAYQAPFRLLDP